MVATPHGSDKNATMIMELRKEIKSLKLQLPTGQIKMQLEAKILLNINNPELQLPTGQIKMQLIFHNGFPEVKLPVLQLHTGQIKMQHSNITNENTLYIINKNYLAY